MSNRRRAFTLIELLAVASIGAVMTGIVSMMLVALLRAEGASRRGMQRESAAYRLGEQFRRDVRSAATVEDSGQQKWRLRLSPQESIDYESLPGEIVRTHRKNGAATAHESFNLWPQSTAALKVEDAGTHPESEKGDGQRRENESPPPAASSTEPIPFVGDNSLVVLTISTEHERELAFEALLGADNRFIETVQSGE